MKCYSCFCNLPSTLMNTRRSFRSAFTLVELLIVITIIGILSVALIPRLLGAPERARDVQRKADLQALATALASYADDHTGNYPTGNLCPVDFEDSGALDAYLTSIPNDPISGNGWDGTTDCVDDGGYLYQPTENGFLLVAELENSSSTGDGIFNATSPINSASGFTTQETMDSLDAYICGGGGAHDDCATDGSIYVLAR